MKIHHDERSIVGTMRIRMTGISICVLIRMIFIAFLKGDKGKQLSYMKTHVLEKKQH